MCNGYGVCDFAKHSCECNAIGAYKEKDGNCYPTCLLLQNWHWFCLVSSIYVLSDDDIGRALAACFFGALLHVYAESMYAYEECLGCDRTRAGQTEPHHISVQLFVCIKNRLIHMFLVILCILKSSHWLGFNSLQWHSGENNCSGHGECKNGLCQCHFDTKAIGRAAPQALGFFGGKNWCRDVVYQ